MKKSTASQIVWKGAEDYKPFLILLLILAPVPVFAPLFIGENARQRARERDEDPEVRGAPLRKGLHLALDDKESFGIPVTYRLVLRHQRAKPRKISVMEQFKGLMDVRSARDAINVLRLNSYLGGDSVIGGLSHPGRRMMEILTPDQFHKKNRQITAPYQVNWSGFGDGFGGMVTDRKLQRKVAKYPLTGRDKYGFRVTRLVAVQKVILGDNTGNLPWAEEITEHVGFDGSYRLITERKVPDEKLQKVEWFFPMKK